MVTNGGRLAAKYVIHCVGPIYRGGEQGEAEALANCYREAVRLAEENGIRSVAFPAVSTGAYRFPVLDAASIAVGTVLDSLEQTTVLQRVRFVLFDVATLKAYTAAAEKLANARPSCRLESVG
jgi:O-acetyl-ADP-ribose deacetylase (regulator of RNase III)